MDAILDLLNLRLLDLWILSEGSDTNFHLNMAVQEGGELDFNQAQNVWKLFCNVLNQLKTNFETNTHASND